jgi:hypothetical protein
MENIIYNQPNLIFGGISITLLVIYIFIFLNKLRYFPFSESFTWISSTIITIIIIGSLYVADKKSPNMTFVIIMYLLLISCSICSLGAVLNATNPLNTSQLKFY